MLLEVVAALLVDSKAYSSQSIVQPAQTSLPLSLSMNGVQDFVIARLQILCRNSSTPGPVLLTPKTPVPMVVDSPAQRFEVNHFSRVSVFPSVADSSTNPGSQFLEKSMQASLNRTSNTSLLGQRFATSARCKLTCTFLMISRHILFLQLTEHGMPTWASSCPDGVMSLTKSIRAASRSSDELPL